MWRLTLIRSEIIYYLFIYNALTRFLDTKFTHLRQSIIYICIKLLQEREKNEIITDNVIIYTIPPIEINGI